jgi:formamidopyrimidine-DNA glycosylase
MDLERGGGPAGHLVGHLRMSGRLEMGRVGDAAGHHDRLLLDLCDGNRLRFIDVRKFGRVEWRGELGPALDALGPEPLDATFTPRWLYEGLKRRRRSLKPLLLDQHFVAGLGNIYVDESLHRARLHPLRRSDGISPKAVERLHEAITETIRAALRDDGSSFDTFYRTPEGKPGRYQDSFQVYGRAGMPCRTCGRAIRRIVVAQRGTHLCTRCQATPRCS